MENNKKSKDYRVKEYKLFGKSTNFLSYIDKDGSIKFLKNKELGYLLKIRPLGYIPKTGILICNYLYKIPKLFYPRILDVGTGESALLSIHSACLYGNSKVMAIDIDKTAIKWAKINVNINKLSRRIKVIKSSASRFNNKYKFDLVISNPPQMPVKQKKSIHDDGGLDGRDCIINIIKLADRILKSNGILVFSAFDFLSVDKNYNGKQSLFNILTKYSFCSKIIGRVNKQIKINSYTFKNLHHIRKIYPKYIFIKNKNGLYGHKIFIICARKSKHKN